MNSSAGRMERAYTYGKIVSKASVIPRPARSTGVRPVLGLMVEPMNRQTGDYYGVPGQNQERYEDKPR
jgi:hypothetical protein